MFELAGLTVPDGAHLTSEIRDQLATGRYERAELSALKATLRQDDVVMELGTGIGVLSAYCARVTGSASVFTFEANPALELPIRALHRANDVSPTLEMCVLGSERGATRLYVHEAFWASSTVTTEASQATVSVPVRPFAEALHAVRPSVLIIDIEGGERELAAALCFDGVRVVIIELHPEVIGEDACAAVLEVIEQAGLVFSEAASSDDVFVLERPAGTQDETVRAAAYLPTQQQQAATREVCDAVPAGAGFVLVDCGLWWQDDAFPDRRPTPMVQRDGQDWGMPADTPTAISELAGRRAEGAELLVFAWPAFWWFDELPELRDALEAQGADLVLENRRLLIYDLTHFAGQGR